MKVHERVKAYIDEKGLKQAVIARKCGIPQVTFNAMLNGRRKMYADDLMLICLALEEPATTFVKASSDKSA